MLYSWSLENICGDFKIYTTINNSYWSANGKLQNLEYRKYSVCLNKTINDPYFNIYNDRKIPKILYRGGRIDESVGYENNFFYLENP